MTPGQKEITAEDKYDVISVVPKHEPMTQQTRPRNTMVIVTDKKTNRRVAVDYCKTARESKTEAIRILEEAL